jgi:putative transposase
VECPYCPSAATTQRPDVTVRGYRRFRCRSCGRGFNERTGSVFNRVQYPPDVVCLVVLWRLRYKLSFRDLGSCTCHVRIIETGLSGVAHRA